MRMMSLRPLDPSNQVSAVPSSRLRSAAAVLGAIVILAACSNPPAASHPPTSGAAPPSTPTSTLRPSPTPTATPTASPTPATGGRPSHIFLLVLENKSASQALGRHADYLKSLADRYGLATNYVATAHPSQPNYVELFSGSTQGVKDNDPHDIDGETLADQLEAAGLTWRVYAENVPTDCFTGERSTGGPDGSGEYRRKHNPAISFTSISGDPSRCANITDFSHFDPTATDFSLIVPNMCHSMHDCSIAKGDAWASDFIGRLMDDPAMDDGLLFITFDEGRGDANEVATIVVSHHMDQPQASDARYTHANLLRTIEDLFGLPCLADACDAQPMSDLLPAG